MSFDRHTKIAFLGMGLMGSRMATRLLQAGFEVAVWNRTRSACDALIDLGATDLALQNIAEYPVVLTCLADDKAALSVYEQIEPFLTAKQVIIDFSSLSGTNPESCSTCRTKTGAMDRLTCFRGNYWCGTRYAGHLCWWRYTDDSRLVFDL